MTSNLSQLVRPKQLEEIVGQKHILNQNHWICNLENSPLPNLIIYGPPGTGKTTFAEIMSKKTNKKLFKINATNSSLSEIREITKKVGTLECPTSAVLYIDEIQYFNKKQQQSLLEFMESGEITLIASTTEKPYFCVYPAILSRSQVLEFKLVEKEEIEKAVTRACKILESNQKIKISITQEALSKIATSSFGDVRKAINMFEICYNSTPEYQGVKSISYDELLKSLEENSAPNHNATGSDHFDLLSAFQKSMRGSDPDASIYYLARLLYVGELESACRRILVCACEDVGLAYPQIIPTIKSLIDTATLLGMPEAKIPLSNAVLLIALSPKSNSSYSAISHALNDIKSGQIFEVPRHIKNQSSEYKYPHDFPNGWTPQNYLPNALSNKKYYNPGNNKNETAFQNYWKDKTNKNF